MLTYVQHIRWRMPHVMCYFDTRIPTARRIIRTIDLVDLPQYRVWYASQSVHL